MIRLLALPSPRRTWLIARTELRRRRRRLSDNSRRLIGISLGGLFGFLYARGLVAGAYFLGIELRTGGAAGAIGLVRTGVGAAVAFGMVFAAYWTVVGIGSLDEPAGVLTTVPYRDAVAGVLLTEYCQALLIGGLPLVGIAAAFALGAASLLSFPIVLLTLLAALALVLVTGYAIGVGAKNVAARSRVVARYKTLLWILAFVVYLGAVVAVSGGTGSSLVGSVFGAFGSSPLGWFADLALVAAPGVTSEPFHLAVAAGLLVVGLPVAFALSVVGSGWFWYVDPVVLSSLKCRLSVDVNEPPGISHPSAKRRAIRLLVGTESDRVYFELEAIDNPQLQVGPSRTGSVVRARGDIYRFVVDDDYIVARTTGLQA